jgi:hypothetical protein
LGCEVVGAGALAGDVGVGSGLTMTNDFFGGPCPTPSCASVTLVAVDAMSKRATIAYFIPTLLGRS